MRKMWHSRVVVLAAAGVLGLSGVAAGQAPVQPTPSSLNDAELLRDFVHYVLIDDYRLAGAHAEELIKRFPMDGEGPIRFIENVERHEEGDRFAAAVQGARNVEATRAMAEHLDNLYETGRRSRARRPDEIARNIELLKGDARGRILARDRLVFASEYAMPQLLESLLTTSDVSLQSEIRGVMIRMGRYAVIPLVTALPELDAARQEIIVNLLSQIEYRTWLPFVAELRQTTTSAQVRASCDRAIARLLRNATLEGDVAYWFFELAERYYAETSELTSFPREDFQLLWTYQQGIGLFPVPIATPVYHEAMAMRLCERSLRHRTDANEALGLWLASNFSRELDTPAEYENPVYPAARPGAMFYAVAFGPEQSQWVLARALDTRHTPLARLAINAVERTAGADAMRRPIVVGVGSNTATRRPLIEALSYPSRRVQYDAALALAHSQAEVMFEGSERVVPLLAGAVTESGRSAALVLSTDAERRAFLRDFMSRRGYEVFAGANLGDVAVGLGTIGGIDVILVDAPSQQLIALAGSVRSDRRLAAAPMMALPSDGELLPVQRALAGDAASAVRAPGLSETMLAAAIDDLVLRAAGGPISDDEARDYANRALDALRDLAVAANPVFDVADAAQPLMATLSRTQGSLRFKVAEVLSRINQRQVQMTLFDAAMSSSGIEKVRLLTFTALNAKRYGNMLDARQRQQLVSLVGSARGPEATEAAALLGALSPAADEVMPLVIPARR
ncbi:MAG: hypothetical protein KF866_11190 [Phycisphaeraceae bacterium]|nr:hypothetical protein [Phycisphaeraceae bacterium]MCW5754260.1 hypothetical protein [Phycisphaeraceae bacterium]